MTRAFFTVDQTDPVNPKPCLHVNGQTLVLSAKELTDLCAGMMWASTACRELRELDPRKEKLRRGYQNLITLPARSEHVHVA